MNKAFPVFAINRFSCQEWGEGGAHNSAFACLFPWEINYEYAQAGADNPASLDCVFVSCLIYVHSSAFPI